MMRIMASLRRTANLIGHPTSWMDLCFVSQIRVDSECLPSTSAVLNYQTDADVIGRAISQ